jgi:hypothetical protein
MSMSYKALCLLKHTGRRLDMLFNRLSRMGSRKKYRRSLSLFTTFWSSRKLKEAKYCEDVRLQEEEEKTLRKANNKHIREQATLLKKKQKEERCIVAAAAKDAKEMEKERKTAEKTELQRKKKEVLEAAVIQKALQLS